MLIAFEMERFRFSALGAETDFFFEFELVNLEMTSHDSNYFLAIDPLG